MFNYELKPPRLMDSKVFTSDIYQCTKCNMQRKRIRIVEQGIDTATGNPYGVMELECGHIEKFFRVTKGFDIAPLFRKTQKVTLEPQIVNGTPSLTVSGGGLSLVGGSVKIDFRETKSDNIIMNISNINVHANTAILDQSMSQHDITTDYSTIQRRIDSDIYNKNDREKIKSTLEEIKNELKLKQIPHSKLEKLKQYERSGCYHCYQLLTSYRELMRG